MVRQGPSALVARSKAPPADDRKRTFAPGATIAFEGITFGTGPSDLESATLGACPTKDINAAQASVARNKPTMPYRTSDLDMINSKEWDAPPSA